MTVRVSIYVYNDDRLELRLIDDAVLFKRKPVDVSFNLSIVIIVAVIDLGDELVANTDLPIVRERIWIECIRKAKLNATGNDELLKSVGLN